MKKNFICLRNCEFIYDSRKYSTNNIFDSHRSVITHRFQAGMAYMINVAYILGDKDDLHSIHKDSMSITYGHASTKFIYKNFVLEDDYFCVNRMFSLLFEMNLPISNEEAKIMRDSLFKKTSHKS